MRKAKWTPISEFTVPDKWAMRCGDSLVLPATATGFAELAIVDPPYNQGEVYDNYDDKKPREEYLQFTREWMEVVSKALVSHGSLWIFAPDGWVSELDLMARNDFGFTKRRHVVWAFTFGQAAARNFTSSHCHLFYLTKLKTKFIFNEAAMRVPSARQLRYNDKRANPKGKMPDATWMLLAEQLEPHMTPDRDTWLYSRVCGTYKERKNVSPNQIPVPIMSRIIAACSTSGGLVFDPFAGTFSSGVAAIQLGRRYLGYDISKKCVDVGLQRVLDLEL